MGLEIMDKVIIAMCCLMVIGYVQISMWKDKDKL